MKHLIVFLSVTLAAVMLFACVADTTSHDESSEAPVGESRQELSPSFESEVPSEPDESADVSSPETSDPLPPPPDAEDVNWSAMNRAEMKELISVGCDYTAPDNTRSDLWSDDGVRLTDGLLAPSNGNNNRYVGFDGSSGNVFTVDLGKETEICSACTALCSGFWGISVPSRVDFSCSTDGKTWTSLGSVNVSDATSSTSEGGWTRYGFGLDFAHTQARYVSFTVITETHIWIDELLVYGYTNAYALYVNAIDNITVFAASKPGKKPSFCGEGQGAIITDMFSGKTAGLEWARIVVFRPDTVRGQYVISDIIIADGDAKENITIPFEGFAYTVNTGNNWPYLYASDPNKYIYAKDFPDYTSAQIYSSFDMVKYLKVGMRVKLFRINLVYGSVDENFGSAIILVEE